MSLTDEARQHAEYVRWLIDTFEPPGNAIVFPIWSPVPIDHQGDPWQNESFRGLVKQLLEGLNEGYICQEHSSTRDPELLCSWPSATGEFRVTYYPLQEKRKRQKLIVASEQ